MGTAATRVQLYESPRTAPPPAGSGLLTGTLALLAAVPLALLIHFIQRAFPKDPEKAVLASGVFAAALVALVPAVFLLRTGWQAASDRLARVVLATVAVVLAAFYLYWVSFYVLFPADILIWSEGDFVNDILKFHAGYPLYTAQANNESFTYVPGAQLLTYLFAWIMGKGISVPTLRAIQVLYTAAAAFVATLCCRKICALSGSRSRGWETLWMPLLFLAATNSISNRYAHNLHNDALAQLISTVAFFLLLVYAETRSRRVLALMALAPALGFFVKQSLAMWAVFYCAYLLLFDRPRSLPRLLAFGAAAFGSLAAVIGGCYLVWGQPFVYWTLKVLGSHAISPLRSFQHLLDVWPYFAVGIVGGWALLRDKRSHVLLGPWFLWLVLIASETYTSGIAWMLNHIGPGSLIAAVWFCAALPGVWSTAFGARRSWTRQAMALCVLALALNGLGVVRIPMRSFSEDAYRYVHDIEREFQTAPANRVLLDAGTWVYTAQNVIMKDRAPCIGERGYSATGDFSGILGRIERKGYSKILVRNFQAPDFWYDHFLWQKPSGIRKALLANYREAGHIQAVAPPISRKDKAEDPYLFGDITILVPRTGEG